MSEERDWEVEARSGGWVPEPDGVSEEKRVDAKTFVERGEKIAGVMKSKVERLESKIDELSKGNADFQKYHQQTLEKEKKKSQERIAQLESERAEAITEGDGTRFTKVDKELTELRSESKEEMQKLNPLAEKWVEENAWYNSNQKLSAFADGIAEKVIAEGYTGKAYFNELTRRTKETFPEEFKNPARSNASSVETDTERQTDDPKPKSWGSLPKADQEQCLKFVKNIPGFTKEQFLTEYDWD